MDVIAESDEKSIYLSQRLAALKYSVTAAAAVAALRVMAALVEMCAKKCHDCQAKLCCCALLSHCGHASRFPMRSSRGLFFRPSLGKHTASWLRLNGQVSRTLFMESTLDPQC